MLCVFTGQLQARLPVQKVRCISFLGYEHGGLNKSGARIFRPIEVIGAYMQNAKMDNGERH